MALKYNKATFLVVSLAMIVALLEGSTAQSTVHVVGDAMGWIVPADGAIVYSNWAANKTFEVNDVLVFNCASGSHDVAEVTKEAFDACDSSFSKITVCPFKITLTSAGEFYYICTFTGHCTAGQKLAINVTSGASSPDPTPTPTSSPPAQTAVHVVGDAMGWTVPTGGATDYSNWVANNTFKVKDVLVFNFTTGEHDVARVTKAAFDSCNTVNSSFIGTTGPANITLTSVGEYYYICTFSSHCTAGQKLAINVTSGASSLDPPPTPTPTSLPPGPDRGSNVRIKLALGIFAGLAGITFTCIIICLFKPTKNKVMTSTTIFRKREKTERDLEAFIRNHGSLAPTRYRYSDVKKMTNSFKDKIGQGGYGGVFKGKLQDGKLVAVKLLNTAKGNGEEFINEVASISRTSHVNVVMLLGFCLEGKKRALVYEFMANGSLEKFIHSIDTLTTNRHLGWEKLYQIALGIARGLEYLHRGCNTRILHFDIKPHNILLDEDFCPKISDFGLAKLCPRKESMVSMLEARGTIGYIAPEVFSRNFGEVSHKSDVYSYGMMILEMVGGRKNLHLGVENSSKIYFPKWVYRHFELGNELKLHDGMSEEENEIAKRMIIVGLWCIQARPLDRPSMNKVIDMLQGSIEALQIPSNPFLSSPPRSPVEDSSPLSFSRSTLDNDV